MSNVITRPRTTPDDYLDLIHVLPLRAIRDDRELKDATAIVTQLMTRSATIQTPGQRDYLSALVILIHDYEGKRFPLPERPPLARLKHLLTESATAPNELRRILGCSQSLVSLILAGKRELQKDHIRKLADFFSMEPGYFL